MPRPQASIILANRDRFSRAVGELIRLRGSLRSMAEEAGLSAPALSAMARGTTNRVRMLTWTRLLIYSLERGRLLRARTQAPEHHSLMRGIGSVAPSEARSRQLLQAADAHEELASHLVASAELVRSVADATWPPSTRRERIALASRVLSESVLYQRRRAPRVS